MKLLINKWAPKQLAINMEFTYVGINCLLVFQKSFFSPIPSLKPLKFHLILTVIAPNKQTRTTQN